MKVWFVWRWRVVSPKTTQSSSSYTYCMAMGSLPNTAALLYLHSDASVPMMCRACSLRGPLLSLSYLLLFSPLFPSSSLPLLFVAFLPPISGFAEDFDLSVRLLSLKICSLSLSFSLSTPPLCPRLLFHLLLLLLESWFILDGLSWLLVCLG